MLVVLLPPLHKLRLPKVYEGTLSLLYRIRRENDTEMIISVAIFPASMKLRRRLRCLNIQMYLHISSSLKIRKYIKENCELPKIMSVILKLGGYRRSKRF
jgi:hypothetical protein